VTQLTQFVGRDVINKNTTDLAVRYSTGSVEFSSVELSCVTINTPLSLRKLNSVLFVLFSSSWSSML